MYVTYVRKFVFNCVLLILSTFTTLKSELHCVELYSIVYLMKHMYVYNPVIYEMMTVRA